MKVQTWIVALFLLISLFTLDSESRGLGQTKSPLLSNQEKLSDYSRFLLTQLNEDQDVRLIVRFKKGEQIAEPSRAIREKQFDRIGVARFFGKKSVISELAADPSVESVEVDQQLNFAIESIPWNINLTNAPTAWNVSKGGVSIAILDSGIASHSDLSIAGGTSVISDNYTDTYGHGTAVAGIISAIIDDSGLVGVAPEANIYAVKIADGSTGMVSDALAGLDWAIANNISVISMSFGFNEYSPAFAAAVQEAYDNGAILIAAAGNNNGEVMFPARYDQVIAVGAVDSQRQRASNSNYGPKLELMAPGVDVNTTWLGGGYSVLSGTSMAAPHVAGIVALIKSANQSLNNYEIRNILRNSASDLGDFGKDDYYGYGLVQYLSNQNTTPIEEPLTIYTIYNLSYVNDSMQLAYWKNGTGSYQQENFTMGQYLINITSATRVGIEILNVTENGTFILQTPTVGFDDDFTVDSSPYTDGIAFVNDRLQTALDNPESQTDAYCFDFTDDGTFDRCGYFSSAELTSCLIYSNTSIGNGKSFYNTCATEDPNKCFHDQYLDTLWNLTTSSKTIHATRLVSYRDCDNSESQHTWAQDTEDHFVVDQRRAICTGDTTYRMDGRYTTSLWITYKTGLNCISGKTCDTTVDNEVTTTNRSTAINPCRLNENQSCTATDQCLSGLNCTSNICAKNSASVDFEIMNIIPVQIVPGVPLIKGKNGVVKVVVQNHGPLNATGIVNITFGGIPLPIYNGENATKFIFTNQEVPFYFTFTANNVGNLTFNASVGIVE